MRSSRGALLCRDLFAAAVTSWLLAMAGQTSAATVQVFSDDLAGFTAAAGGSVVIEDFSDAALVPGFSIIFGSELPGSISGGQYQDRANDLQAVEPTFTFGAGATAFGAEWNLSAGNPGVGIQLFLTFADLTTQAVSPQILREFEGEFFGIVSDVPIISIRLDEGSGQSTTNNVETFTADNARIVFVTQALPEPGSLFLVGIGLLGAFGSLRRRRRS